MLDQLPATSFQPPATSDKRNRRRRLPWKTLKRGSIEQLKALPVHIRLARFCTAIVTAVLAEPMLGWFLAVLLGSAVLIALFLRFSHEPPVRMDLAPRPKDRLGREL